MKENLGIKMVGEIILLSNGKEVLKTKNQIQPTAGEVVLRSIANLPQSLNVNEITLNGSFKKQVFDTIINPDEISITFITQIAAQEFIGTIQTLELGISDTVLLLAKKEGLNLIKDGETVVEIQWKITLIIN